MRVFVHLERKFERIKIVQSDMKKKKKKIIIALIWICTSNQNLLINIFEKFVRINETYIHKWINFFSNLDHNSINNYSWICFFNMASKNF